MDIDLAALRTIERDKEISFDYLIKTLEDALLNAYDKTDNHLRGVKVEIDRKAAGYPIVLVSYAIACADYKDDALAELVKGYLGYIASEEGQNTAAEAAGSAPLAADLRDKVLASIDSIK